MITIYYSRIDPLINNGDFVEHLSSMPLSIQRKISKLKSAEEKCTSLAGYLLLKNGLKERGLSYHLENLKYTEYGKPYTDNKIDFNISHSNGHVVCAFSTVGRVGMDIELIRPIDISYFKKIFRADEWKFIMSSVIPVEAFFYLWTAKEAILKADGRGLNAPLNKIYIGVNDCRLEEAVWYCHTIPVFGRFITHLAIESKTDKFIVKEINLVRSAL